MIAIPLTPTPIAVAAAVVAAAFIDSVAPATIASVAAEAAETTILWIFLSPCSVPA